MRPKAQPRWIQLELPLTTTRRDDDQCRVDGLAKASGDTGKFEERPPADPVSRPWRTSGNGRYYHRDNDGTVWLFRGGFGPLWW